MRDFDVIELPHAAGEGKPREVRVVEDTPYLKLSLITLRNGEVLPEHSTPMPVTLQAVSGSGTVRVGERAERIAPGRMVVLSHGVEHEITPDAGSDLVLLVHHLKAARHGGERPWTGEQG